VGLSFWMSADSFPRTDLFREWDDAPSPGSEGSVTPDLEDMSE